MHGIGDPARPDPLAGLVGGSPALGLRRELRAIAAADSTLLVTGETGTGKGLVARLVHEASRRARGPFVHVDCAALAPTIIESELFGHERGAFTGAELARDGRLATAAGGTLFLDEVGELEARLQAKLLRALQDRAFERVGGSRTLAMNARIVAATNRNLRAAVADGSFRADLYHRLRVLELRLPPLRERPEDIPALVDHGLREAARRLGRAAPPTTECFAGALAAHVWPGNVRELLNLLERLLVRHPGATLDAGLLAAELDPWPDAAPATSAAVRDAGGGEESQIARALIETGGNVARAARRLGLPRGTLRHRIERFGLRHLIPRD